MQIQMKVCTVGQTPFTDKNQKGYSVPQYSIDMEDPERPGTFTVTTKADTLKEAEDKALAFANKMGDYRLTNTCQDKS